MSSEKSGRSVSLSFLKDVPQVIEEIEDFLRINFHIPLKPPTRIEVPERLPEQGVSVDDRIQYIEHSLALRKTLECTALSKMITQNAAAEKSDENISGYEEDLLSRVTRMNTSTSITSGNKKTASKEMGVKKVAAGGNNHLTMIYSMNLSGIQGPLISKSFSQKHSSKVSNQKAPTMCKLLVCKSSSDCHLTQKTFPRELQSPKKKIFENELTIGESTLKKPQRNHQFSEGYENIPADKPRTQEYVVDSKKEVSSIQDIENITESLIPLSPKTNECKREYISDSVMEDSGVDSYMKTNGTKLNQGSKERISSIFGKNSRLGIHKTEVNCVEKMGEKKCPEIQQRTSIKLSKTDRGLLSSKGAFGNSKQQKYETWNDLENRNSRLSESIVNHFANEGNAFSAGTKLFNMITDNENEETRTMQKLLPLSLILSTRQLTKKRCWIQKRVSVEEKLKEHSHTDTTGKQFNKATKSKQAILEIKGVEGKVEHGEDGENSGISSVEYKNNEEIESTQILPTENGENIKLDLTSTSRRLQSAFNKLDTRKEKNTNRTREESLKMMEGETRNSLKARDDHVGYDYSKGLANREKLCNPFYKENVPKLSKDSNADFNVCFLQSGSRTSISSSDRLKSSIPRSISEYFRNEKGSKREPCTRNISKVPRVALLKPSAPQKKEESQKKPKTSFSAARKVHQAPGSSGLQAKKINPHSSKNRMNLSTQKILQRDVHFSRKEQKPNLEKIINPEENATNAERKRVLSKRETAEAASESNDVMARKCSQITVPEPFSLSGERLRQKNLKKLAEETRLRELEENRRRSFKARPMPDFSKAANVPPKSKDF